MWLLLARHRGVDAGPGHCSCLLENLDRFDFAGESEVLEMLEIDHRILESVELKMLHPRGHDEFKDNPNLISMLNQRCSYSRHRS